MCRQMQAHYPHQEFAEDTVRGYLFDLERLAVLYGVDVLRVALLNLRIRPGQKFFPHPSEVSDEIERMRQAARRDNDFRETCKRLAEQEEWFWKWVDQRMSDPDTQGMTEQQFLDMVKTPGYAGRKARNQRIGGS